MAAYSQAVTQLLCGWTLAIPDLLISFAIRRDAFPNKRAPPTSLAVSVPGQGSLPSSNYGHEQHQRSPGRVFRGRMSPC
jgi:hypothetical protein